MKILKSVLRLLRTARIKMRIRIAVQHQDACTLAGWILSSSGDNKNKVYVNMIDNLYVIVV